MLKMSPETNAELGFSLPESILWKIFYKTPVVWLIIANLHEYCIFLSRKGVREDILLSIVLFLAKSPGSISTIVCSFILAHVAIKGSLSFGVGEPRRRCGDPNAKLPLRIK